MTRFAAALCARALAAACATPREVRSLYARWGAVIREAGVQLDR